MGDCLAIVDDAHKTALPMVLEPWTNFQKSIISAKVDFRLMNGL